MHNTIIQEYLEACCGIAKGAGEVLMRYFKGDYTTQAKQDKSPVTDADIAANHYIRKELRALAPDLPVVAEEDETFDRHDHPVFWLVDPLDGTRSFVRHEPEFSVNIGLIRDRRPALGVIYAPVQDILYFGIPGKGAFRRHGKEKPQLIRCRAPGEKVVITRSRTQPTATSRAWLATQRIETMISMSSAIKFGLVAEGQADIYPRFGRTMEWDTAAGHAIVQAAGGRVETVDGKPLAYGKPNFENPPFIAYGK